MERSWAYLERLSRFPHRGVGSEHEAAAADLCALWLGEMGYAVEIQRFRAPRDTLYLGPAAIMLIMLAGAGLALYGLGWAGLLLALAALAPLAGEMLGRRFDLGFLLPKVRSQNVIARTAPGAEPLTLVLSAHIDTQRATWLFHPRLVRCIPAYLNLAFASLGLMPVSLLLYTLFGGATWTAWLMGCAAALLFAHLIFLAGSVLTGRFINGANDNGSGSALLLALAEHFASHPLPGAQLEFVLTGAEEVGTRGMKRFMQGAAYDKRSTYFINLDNLGGGDLHYLEGEGMTLYHRFGPSLVGLAGAMAAEVEGRVRVKANLLLPTDGMIPAALGYQAISFLAFQPDGSLPDYHWYSDTPDKVDRELLADTERFLQEYIGRLVAAVLVER